MDQKNQNTAFNTNMTEEAFLSNEDIDLVLNSWRSVRQNLENIGTAIFLKMFEQYPSYHSLFKKFSDVPLENLPTNKVFVRHALTVAESLDKTFMQLKNLETTKEALEKIGKIHSNKNMEISHFTHCNEAMLNVLKRILEEKFDKDIEAAWNKLLPVIAILIHQGMKTQ